MSAPRVRDLGSLPGGDGASRRTLDQMAAEVRAGLADPLTQRLTRRILLTVPRQDRTGAAQMIRLYLGGRFRFLTDALAGSLLVGDSDVELLNTPHELARQILDFGEARGDCDDAAILAAAIGQLAGLPARFHVVGFDGPDGAFRHVWTDLLTALGWLDMDVTRPAQGPLPDVTREQTMVL